MPRHDRERCQDIGRERRRAALKLDGDVMIVDDLDRPHGEATPQAVLAWWEPQLERERDIVDRDGRAVVEGGLPDPAGHGQLVGRGDARPVGELGHGVELRVEAE